MIVIPDAKTARSYVHSSEQNIRTWRTDGQTDRYPLAITVVAL